jgi:hypothetical protein
MAVALMMAVAMGVVTKVEVVTVAARAEAAMR